ncbi:hypothetical protein U1Q18_034317 [Sarracenia purpurea var. burkii]
MQPRFVSLEHGLVIPTHPLEPWQQLRPLMVRSAGRFLLEGAGGRCVLSALVICRCFLFSFIWVVGWACVALGCSSWGVAFGGAGGWSGWQGWVLGIWLRMRRALKDNGLHLCSGLLHFYAVWKALALPFRIRTLMISPIPAAEVFSLLLAPLPYVCICSPPYEAERGPDLGVFCRIRADICLLSTVFKLRALVGVFEENRLFPCLNHVSFFPVWALPRGFIFITCHSLGLGENAVKVTDADSLWRLGFSDWAPAHFCCYAYEPLSVKQQP